MVGAKNNGIGLGQGRNELQDIVAHYRRAEGRGVCSDQGAYSVLMNVLQTRCWQVGM